MIYYNTQPKIIKKNNDSKTLFEITFLFEDVYNNTNTIELKELPLKEELIITEVPKDKLNGRKRRRGLF